MSDTSIPQEELTAEMIEDFMDDFNNNYERSEAALIWLEADPENADLINDLFRSVHTIKGSLSYVGLTDLVPLLQNMEDILASIRKGEIKYDDLLSDAVLLTMDATRALVRTAFYQEESNIDASMFERMCNRIADILRATHPDARREAVRLAILELSPESRSDADIQASPTSSTAPISVDQILLSDKRTVDHAFNVELQDRWQIEIIPDISFLTELLAPIEKRIPFWQGRTRRIAQISLAMNELGDLPVDPTQLLASVYAHDIGMAFLPLPLLTKEGQFSADEKKLMREHINTGYHILRRLSGWGRAAKIVEQHHEWFNGQGYPNQLEGPTICAGAKILSIADTFDACVHGRPHHNDPQRPLIRAILEVNRFADTQFDPHWTEIFNQMARAYLVTKAD